EVGGARVGGVDGEFGKKVGVEDGDIGKMRGEVKTNLVREVKVRLKNRMKEQVMQAVLDATKLDPPHGLMQQEIERLQATARQDLAQRGVKVKNDVLPLPGELVEAQARRRVSLGLILAELVKVHSLSPKPDPVCAEVEEEAAR